METAKSISLNALQYYRLSERSAALRNRDRRRKEFSALPFRTR